MTESELTSTTRRQNSVGPIAIIGGTGLDRLESLEITRRQVVDTPYGSVSAPLIHGRCSGQEVIFLPRHGEKHQIPPHRINYRANLWALRQSGARTLLAIAAVGGIRRDLAPGRLAVPDQIIDYTWAREHTFFDAGGDPVEHIDFTHPYCAELRAVLLRAAGDVGLAVAVDGTYGATQGPRLETAAEIRRMRRDGCDMVGMTGMPEAALAKELGLCYACCAVVANWAAGCGGSAISMQEIERILAPAMVSVARLIERVTEIG